MVRLVIYISFFYGCFYFALPIYSQSFAKSFYFSVEPSKEGSTENRNLLSAQATHNVQTLRALLSAMEALPQAPWLGKAARFMANSGTPHLWAHVRQFFLKSLMFYIFFGWCRCDGAMSSHKTLVKTFAFGPKHCMMTGGNQPTIGLASATSQPRNRRSNRQNWF